MSLAHIVNVFDPPLSSDLREVLPITYETMKLAAEGLEVELLSAQYAEDRSLVPKFLRPTEDLHKYSPAKLGNLKLPYLSEILQRAYAESEAEYIIFSNSDIAVQKHFYTWCAARISDGLDAFIVNRRRIPAYYDTPKQLLEMQLERGLSHPGFDCFVFRREMIPEMKLGEILLGVPFVGITMSQNLFALADNFKLFRKQLLTQHIGLEVFKKRAPRRYFYHNRDQFRKCMEKLGDRMDSRRLPFSNLPLPIRMLKWGLHPGIPIKLCLELERRRSNSKGEFNLDRTD